MGRLQYKERILSLYKKEMSHIDIVKTIFKEYGIRFTVSKIEEIINSKPLEMTHAHSNDAALKLKMIKGVLEKSEIPLDIAAICSKIKKIYSERVGKKEASQLISLHLKELIVYEEFLNTYSLAQKQAPAQTITDPLNLNFVKNRLESVFGDLKELDISTSVVSYFKSQLFNVSTGIEKMDYLIKTVVKDNIITHCEEVFLISKAIELGFNKDIISHAKKSLQQNNPYLDNIIHIIFEDGLITTEELIFLKEKASENHFSPKFVNERFWILGLAQYFNDLVKIDQIKDVVIMAYLLHKLESQKKPQLSLIKALDIYKYEDLKITTQMARDRLYLELNEKLSLSIGYEFDYAKYLIEVVVFHKQVDQNESKTGDDVLLARLMKLIHEERLRIGTPDVNLLVENINYRIKNDLWD